MEILKCARCGAEENLIEINGEMYCESCLREMGFEECTDCGEWFLMDGNGANVVGYGPVCENCLTDGNYGWCDHCETYHPIDDLHEVNLGWRSRGYICDDCLNSCYSNFERCEDCGEIINTDYDNYIYVRGHGYVCESCADDYAYCECCEEYVPYNEAIWSDEDDCYYCEDCYNRNHSESDNHTLKRYGYKPEPKPRVHEDHADDCMDVKDLLFGVELEVDKGPRSAVSDTISRIADISNDVYMKSDGSLDTGFEIVTHPATLGYHMHDFAWRSITETARSAGFKSHDARTCGLHVHVGRYQLSPEDPAERYRTTAKIVLLVNRHWDALVKFSRRKEDQLHWAVRPQVDRIRETDTADDILGKMMCADNGNRYQAVNLCNSGTIEFRLFNGSLKRDTVIATLQMVNNICKYAMTHSTEECLASTWADLRTYEEWDELNAYCEANNLITVESPEAVVFGKESEKEKPFKTGAVVRYVGVDGPENLMGVIVEVSDYDYAVRFNGFTGGHDLCGLLDRLSTDGWWCRDNDLELVA